MKENKTTDGELELEERIKYVLIVNDDYKDKIPSWLKQLTPIPKPDPQESRYQIRLSNETEHGLMYDFSEILKSCDKKCINEIDDLVESNVLKHYWIGQINRSPLRHIGYLDKFEGVTTTDIADYFCVEPESAAWIIDLLMEGGVLKRDTIQIYRFTTDDKLWNDQVAIQQEQ